MLHANGIDQNDEENTYSIPPQQKLEYGYHLGPPQMETVYNDQHTQPTNVFRSTGQQTGNAFGWQSTQTNITDPYRPLPRETNFNPVQSPGYGYDQGMSSTSTTTIVVRKLYLAFVFYMFDMYIN